MENDLLTSFKPEAQLVVYGNRSQCYIEHHEIIEVAGKPVLSEGKPLTKRSLKKMLDLVLASDKTVFATVNKLLPENVLYYDPRPGKLKLVWYNKSCIRQLIGINKRAVSAKLPAFVYIIDEDTIQIFAMKTGARRPDLKTQLFHAPLPNVYQEGNVCMGNVKKPRASIEISDLITAWEKAFWGSEFTDFLWDDKAAKKLRTFIKQKKPFPNNELLPMKKTLKAIL